MLKEKNLKSTVIANKVKQSHQIATPYGLAMTESGRSTSSSSFPCLTRESTWCGLNAPRCAQYAQSGRSMVEMLGVLAVIGVLSIAGIAGYSNAMNKHRANELLNEASKRAAIVAVQAMQGRENLSISEFGTENTRLNFSETVDHDTTNNQFTLTITGVAEAVCQQMNNAKGPVIRKFEPATCSGDNNTVKLTFNDDMSATEKASDFTTSDTCKSPYKWCSESETCVSGDCTCSGTAPECQICDPATGGYTADHNQDEQSCTPTGGGTGTCNDGTCVATPTCLDNTSGVKCLSNTTDENGNPIELCSGYYCKVGGSCSGSTYTYTITAGNITALPSAPISKDGKYHTGGKMTWDAAYYYCEALSKIPGSGITGLAGKDNTDLPDDKAYWLNSLSPSGSTPTSSNSCSAWFVSAGYKISSGRNRANTFYALCE